MAVRGGNSAANNNNGNLDMFMLLDMDDPVCVYGEVKTILGMTYGNFNDDLLSQAFYDTVSLYQGKYPGFRGCNTEYHDLKHTTDVFLAMARLLHGYHIEGMGLKKRTAELALISALLHDAGYIQTEEDTEGTGAKYTVIHVARSIEFANVYLKNAGMGRSEINTCGRMIKSTDLMVNLREIEFQNADERSAGKVLLIADLLGQMADRLYLEKLLFLFQEFTEGRILGYADEDELLRKTLGFYEIIMGRLYNDAGYSESHMTRHFEARWDVNRDLYVESMIKNIDYLKHIVENHNGRYREKLNRGGIVDRLRRMESGPARRHG